MDEIERIMVKLINIVGYVSIGIAIVCLLFACWLFS